MVAGDDDEEEDASDLYWFVVRNSQGFAELQAVFDSSQLELPDASGGPCTCDPFGKDEEAARAHFESIKSADSSPVSLIDAAEPPSVAQVAVERVHDTPVPVSTSSKTGLPERRPPPPLEEGEDDAVPDLIGAPPVSCSMVFGSPSPAGRKSQGSNLSGAPRGPTMATGAKFLPPPAASLTAPPPLDDDDDCQKASAGLVTPQVVQRQADLPLVPQGAKVVSRIKMADAGSTCSMPGDDALAKWCAHGAPAPTSATTAVAAPAPTPAPTVGTPEYHGEPYEEYPEARTVDASGRDNLLCIIVAFSTMLLAALAAMLKGVAAGCMRVAAVGRVAFSVMPSTRALAARNRAVIAAFVSIGLLAAWSAQAFTADPNVSSLTGLCVTGAQIYTHRYGLSKVASAVSRFVGLIEEYALSVIGVLILIVLVRAVRTHHTLP